MSVQPCNCKYDREPLKNDRPRYEFCAIGCAHDCGCRYDPNGRGEQARPSHALEGLSNELIKTCIRRVPCSDHRRKLVKEIEVNEGMECYKNSHCGTKVTNLLRFGKESQDQRCAIHSHYPKNLAKTNRCAFLQYPPGDI